MTKGDKVLGIIFPNMHDNAIGELTKLRTMASVPFGGRYRLIDFTLSEMVAAGIDDILDGVGFLPLADRLLQLAGYRVGHCGVHGLEGLVIRAHEQLCLVVGQADGGDQRAGMGHLLRGESAAACARQAVAVAQGLSVFLNSFQLSEDIVQIVHHLRVYVRIKMVGVADGQIGRASCRERV